MPDVCDYCGDIIDNFRDAPKDHVRFQRVLNDHAQSWMFCEGDCFRDWALQTGLFW